MPGLTPQMLMLPSRSAQQSVRFPGQVVWIKFIGTHGSYDRIDVKKL